MNDNNIFQISGTGIDTSTIIKTIEANLIKRKTKGAYSCVKPWDSYLSNPSDNSDLENYIAIAKELVLVDINDFEIEDKHPIFNHIIVISKKILWKCLKFYTYRLWRQQNDINSLLLSITEAIEEKNRIIIKQLQEKITQLEDSIKKMNKT